MSCSSTSSGSGSGSEEDEGGDAYRKGGYHAVRIGDQFAAGRYIAQRKLGWGNFSTVWLAYDTQSKKFVALKIQKSAPEFAQAALHEIEFLSEITTHDPQNRRCILQLLDHFKHAGPNGQHLCLVFEFLGDSLLRLVRYNRYKGIGLNRVRQICKDVLVGLDYLHQLGIIHTDLKPENVLLISTIDPSKDPIRSNFEPILDRPSNPNSSSNTATVNKIEKRLKEHAKAKLARISKQRPSMAARPVKKERDLSSIDLRCKIVDFGNACWRDKQFGDIIQTRQYRAPEVVIGLGYGCEADMWSFGCIAYELATGDVLFCPKEGHGFSEDEDHLALMMELLGKMPKKIAISGSRSKEYFDRHGDLKRIRRLGFKPLDKVLMDRYKFTEIDALEFMNFLSPLLDFDPSKRPTASQCLSHPWLQINKENNNNNDKNNNINININNENNANVKNASACSSTSSSYKEKESVGIMRSNSGNNIRSKSEIISKFNNKVHNRDENEKEKNKGERNVNEKEKSKGERSVNEKEKSKGERSVNEKDKSKGERSVNEKEKSKGERSVNEKEKSKGEKVVSNEGENLAMVKRFASRFNEKINQNKINNINNNINLTRSKTTRETNSNPPAYSNATQNTNNTANNPSHNVNNTNNNVNNNIITRNNNENVNNNNNTDERQSNNNEPIGRVAIAMSKLGVSGRINSRRIG